MHGYESGSDENTALFPFIGPRRPTALNQGLIKLEVYFPAFKVALICMLSTGWRLWGSLCQPGEH